MLVLSSAVTLCYYDCYTDGSTNTGNYGQMYTLPNIIRMIKPRRMKFTGYVACMGKKSNAYCVLVENSEGKSPL
jgi:hypothetical protein